MASLEGGSVVVWKEPHWTGPNHFCGLEDVAMVTEYDSDVPSPPPSCNVEARSLIKQVVAVPHITPCPKLAD